MSSQMNPTDGGGGPPMPKKEIKSFALKVEDVEPDGTFTGYASTFGNVDSYGEIVDRGAFRKTVRERRGVFPLLWQHDSREPIGVSAEMTEDDHGLHVRGQINLATDKGREAHALLKDSPGALGGMSIGFRVITEALKDGIRHLKEIKLYEFSLVTFPANEAAVVTGVKSEDGHAVLEAATAWAEAARGSDITSADREMAEAATKALTALLTEPGTSPTSNGAATSDTEPGMTTRAVALLKKTYEQRST